MHGDMQSLLSRADRALQATDTARKILQLREYHREVITQTLGRAAANGHRTLEYLYQHPIVTVTGVQKEIGTTYPAANNLVARLVEQGILHEMTGRVRHRQFLYVEYLQLFHE